MIKKRYGLKDIHQLNLEQSESFLYDSNIFISSKRTVRTDWLYSKLDELNTDRIEKLLFDFDVNGGEVEDALRSSIKNYGKKHVRELLSPINIDDECNADTLVVTVDISLINRSSIASIFAELFRASVRQDIKINIIYSIAKYREPETDFMPITEAVEPVHEMFSGWSSKPGLPVMTVVGLGYEKNRALGAVEYLESSSCVLFLPRSPEQEYREQLEDKNNNLLSLLGKHEKLDYDVLEPVKTLFHLDSILASNKSSHKVVLLPFGPKIFYACSLLAAIVNPEVAVWNASGNEAQSLEYQNRRAVGAVGFSCIISSIRS